jgi:hypothetical protein
MLLLECLRVDATEETRVRVVVDRDKPASEAIVD